MLADNGSDTISVGVFAVAACRRRTDATWIRHEADAVLSSLSSTLLIFGRGTEEV